MSAKLQGKYIEFKLAFFYSTIKFTLSTQVQKIIIKLEYLTLID